MKKYLWILAAMLIIAGCTKKPVQGEQGPEPQQEQVADENAYIDIKALTPEGTELALSELVGKTDYVLVDFWASWCGPCRRFVPVLKEIYASQPEGRLQILSCSVDQDAKAWQVALQEEQMPWPQMREDAEHMCSDKYDVQFIPHTVLIDREGQIVGVNLEEPEIEEILLGE
ncbi:MAG: TlpA family protein disulfide reductase [Paludibacteraceae bacterium]|nr:TlpA family protein disulfide reductase [Paludibacteraceae bacterium]